MSETKLNLEALIDTYMRITTPAKYVFELVGDEEGNFHGISAEVECIGGFAAAEWFANSESHPEYYGVVSQSKLPRLCRSSTCECGSSVHVELIDDALRAWLAGVGIAVPEEGVLVAAERYED